MRTRLGVLFIALLAVAATPAGTTLSPSQLDVFMRNDGTACPGNPYLDTVPGSNEVGCGYQGGAPFGELYHAGAYSDTVKHYGTPWGVTVAGFPAILDASRNITGNNRVVATATTQRNAVGQVRVDVTVSVTFQGGSTAVLGTDSGEVMFLPTQGGELDIPFAVDIADTHDKKRITAMNIDVDIRGVHVLTGYHRLNGISKLTLPTFIEVTT